MKKIVIICCYFGMLRKDYKNWMASVKNNSTIDWLLFTDCDWGINIPKNINIIKLSFQEFVNKVQSKYDFKIVLEKPYKICDYKPAFGDIFNEYIQGKYDFWGFCDFDMIFGDLRKFFTEEVLEKYDKVFTQGHLSIFKNNNMINQLYKSNNSPINYKEVFTTNIIKVFDEECLNKLFENNNLKVYTPRLYCDLNKFSKKLMNFESNNLTYKMQTYIYKHGTLEFIYKDNKKLIKREICYIHFSGKEFNECISEYYQITSNGIIEIQSDLENEMLEKINFLFFRKNIAKIKKLIFKIKRKIKKEINLRKEKNINE